MRLLGPLAVAGLACWLPSAGHAVIAASSQCPAEEVCVWSGAGYSGAFTLVHDETCDAGPVGSALENDPDSLQELRIYPQPGCTGTPVVLRSGQAGPTASGRSYQNWHDPRDPNPGP